jgi:P-type E1-E2 ATPase
VEYADPESFDSVTGKGVCAAVDGAALCAADRSSGHSPEPRDGDVVLVGKPGWLADEGVDLSIANAEIERLQNRGLTVSGVVREGGLVGLVGIGDEIKDDAVETMQRMRDADITPVILTGDNERTAQAVAEEVGIDRVMADVLPDEKREEIGRLQGEGHRVAMVGDGINDAPALTQADIGIAIGAGTDIAIESADVVLMGDRLGGVMDAHEIGEESYRKTRQNLAAAFTFNGVGVAAATTGLVHPVFAMIAMVLSVSAVLANSFVGQLFSGEGVDTEFVVEDASGTATDGGAERGEPV